MKTKKDTKAIRLKKLEKFIKEIIAVLSDTKKANK